MIPTIEACWDWAQKREDMNAPFDFFVYEDAHEKARQLLDPLEYYFIDSKAFTYTFYNTYLHYCIVTDYKVEYEKVWAPRPMGNLDRVDMSELVPASTTPATDISSQPKQSIPMTELTPSNNSSSIPWTDLTPTQPKESIPWTDLTPAQRWVINTMFQKYNIAANSVIYNSVSDGSSSTSAQMFKSLNEGDFLMQDLLRTSYGTYTYQILEQMRPTVVLL